MASTTAQPLRSRAFAARLNLGSTLRSQSSTFYLILGTTVFLVVIGLVLVLSASSVESYLNDDGFYGKFLKQLLFATLGIPAMLVASRLPLVFWKKWTVLLVAIGAGAQLLVFTPLGVTEGGNTNWIRIGNIAAQPGELLKLGLALGLGIAFPRVIARYGDTRKVLMPLVFAAVVMGLVLLGGDLGTAIIMFLIVLGCMIYAGIRWRFILVPIAVAIVGFLFIAILSPNRVARITTFFTTTCSVDNSLNWCWQPLHGTWAMASGGFFGVGLGNSKMKWSWLPAADNDYIFAIIGEELGLLGCVVVLALVVILAVGFLRVIKDATDPLIRIATGGIMFWLIGQAFMNIAVVLGLIPVLGVPLPFISSGGTALFTALGAVGVVLSFARHNERSRTLR